LIKNEKKTNLPQKNSIEIYFRENNESANVPKFANKKPTTSSCNLKLGVLEKISRVLNSSGVMDLIGLAIKALTYLMVSDVKIMTITDERKKN